LTEYFGLTKGTVSQTLQVLECKGYIEKQLDEEDARVTHLLLSKNGELLLKNANNDDVFNQAQQAVLSKQYATLDDALRMTLFTLQKKVVTLKVLVLVMIHAFILTSKKITTLVEKLVCQFGKLKPIKFAVNIVYRLNLREESCSMQKQLMRWQIS
jgi:DNA-binding MarR family transcriptional regulator